MRWYWYSGAFLLCLLVCLALVLIAINNNPKPVTWDMVTAQQAGTSLLAYSLLGQGRAVELREEEEEGPRVTPLIALLEHGADPNLTASIKVRSEADPIRSV